LTRPNSSSDSALDAPDPASASAPDAESGVGLRALAGRLAEEFGAGPDTLARVASVFGEVRDQAPDLLVPAAGALIPAFTETQASGGGNVEPIYENVEPVYENVEPIREPVISLPPVAARALYPAVPEVPAETPVFIEAMLAGERERCFGMLREVARSGGDPEAFFTQAACALDDAYRARLEGVPVHPEIARITQGVATPVLERLVTALTVAVDSSYSIGITGAKLALTRALATIGA